MIIAPVSTKKIRVLCLHGFRTNIQVMQNQVRGIRAALGANAEFVFINAPFEARGPTDEVIQRLHGKDAPFYEWWQGRYLEPDEQEAEAAIPSESGNKWNLFFEDIDQSLEYADEKIQALGPFDIALGFSQGATMTTILTTWYQQKRGQAPWKFVICVGGVGVHAANLRGLYETSEGKSMLVEIPSIHIAGRKDPLFEESLLLCKLYAEYPVGTQFKRMLLEHDSGHRFPSPGRNKEFYESIGHAVHQFFDNTNKSAFARL